MTNSVECKAIKVFLDTNALQGVCKHKDYFDLLTRIDALHLGGMLDVHLNPISILEQLQGVTSNSFEHVRTVIQRGGELCANGKLRLSPKLHLLDSVCGVTNEECEVDGGLAVGIRDALISCESFGQFVERLGSERQYLLDTREYLHSNAHAIRKVMNESKQSLDNPGQARFSDGGDDLKYALMASFLKRLGVWDRVKNSQIGELLARSRSLSYYMDVQFAYAGRMYSDQERKPKIGDNADMIQVVYLDVCDYIITNDRGIGEILRISGNQELLDRVASVDQFERHVRSPYLTKRASNPGRNWTVRLEP